MDDALDDVKGRINEAEHNDKRKPALEGDEELVVGVDRIGKAPHFNVDVVGALAGEHFNEDAADAVLQRQEALLVVTGIASFRTVFESRSRQLENRELVVGHPGLDWRPRAAVVVHHPWRALHPDFKLGKRSTQNKNGLITCIIKKSITQVPGYLWGKYRLSGKRW